MSTPWEEIEVPQEGPDAAVVGERLGLGMDVRLLGHWDVGH